MLLHVTDGGVQHGSNRCFRSGTEASRRAPGGRSETDSDMGSRCTFAQLCIQGPPAIACRGQEHLRPRRPGIYRYYLRSGCNVRRGEIWTASGGGGYAGKPRPVVILQDDRFDATASITICVFTTDSTSAPLFRLVVKPSERNGLKIPCRLMVDKITTVAKNRIGGQIGRLDDEDIVRLNRAVLVFLGFAGSGSGN
jgi:mRNA interferase MazF